MHLRMASRFHVAILHRRYIGAILAGEKTVESRLSRTRRDPYGTVRPGDTIYFKASGGGYLAIARVRRVEHRGGLTPSGVRALRLEINQGVCATHAYWHSKRHSRYATLIWFDSVRATDRGPSIGRLYGSAWLLLKPGELKPSEIAA